MAANRHDPSRENEPNIAERRGRHEESDVNAWAVGRFGIALLLTAIGALALMFGLFRYFQTSITAVEGPEVVPSKQPPQPRLVPNEPQAWDQVRAAEQQTLNSYGWIDRAKGVVRIPIQHAMELTAQRGLPSRPVPGPLSAAAGVSVPTESSLGPIMQQVGGPLVPELKASGVMENQAK